MRGGPPNFVIAQCKEDEGGGGVPQIFFSHHKSYFFFELGPHAKFHNTRTTPSGRKVCDPERKEERKKNNAKNSGHYVSAATPRAAQALRSDQYFIT